MSGSLGEREMLWEQADRSVSIAFSSSPKLSQVFLLTAVLLNYRFRAVAIKGLLKAIFRGKLFWP